MCLHVAGYCCRLGPCCLTTLLREGLSEGIDRLLTSQQNVGLCENTRLWPSYCPFCCFSQVIGKTIYEEDTSKEEDTHDALSEENRRFRLAMLSLHILFALMRGPAFRSLSWCWPQPLPGAQRRRRAGRSRARSSITSSSRFSKSARVTSTFTKSITVSSTRDLAVGATGAANGASRGEAAEGGSANSIATRTYLVHDRPRERSDEQRLEQQKHGATAAAEGSVAVVNPAAPPAKSSSTTTPSECPESAVDSSKSATEKCGKSALSPELTGCLLGCSLGENLKNSWCVPRVVTTRRRRRLFWDAVSR